MSFALGLGSCRRRSENRGWFHAVRLPEESGIVQNERATIQKLELGVRRQNDLRSTNKAIVVGRTHRAAEVNIGFVRSVAGEDFFLRVPLEFAARPQGDDDQVADAGR